MKFKAEKIQPVFEEIVKQDADVGAFYRTAKEEGLHDIDCLRAVIIMLATRHASFMKDVQKMMEEGVTVAVAIDTSNTDDKPETMH